MRTFFLTAYVVLFSASMMAQEDGDFMQERPTTEELNTLYQERQLQGSWGEIDLDERERQWEERYTRRMRRAREQRELRARGRRYMLENEEYRRLYEELYGKEWPTSQQGS